MWENAFLENSKLTSIFYLKNYQHHVVYMIILKFASVSRKKLFQRLFDSIHNELHC